MTTTLTRPPGVPRRELSSYRMVAGNEKLYSTVIDDGRLKDWVGIGWIDIGMATEEHKAQFPTVIEDV